MTDLAFCGPVSRLRLETVLPMPMAMDLCDEEEVDGCTDRFGLEL